MFLLEPNLSIPIITICYIGKVIKAPASELKAVLGKESPGYDLSVGLLYICIAMGFNSLSESSSNVRNRIQDFCISCLVQHAISWVSPWLSESIFSWWPKRESRGQVHCGNHYQFTDRAQVPQNKVITENLSESIFGKNRRFQLPLYTWKNYSEYCKKDEKVSFLKTANSLRQGLSPNTQSFC